MIMLNQMRPIKQASGIRGKNLKSDHSGAPPKVTIICNDTDYFLRHRKIIADRLAALGISVRVLAGGRRLATAGAGWTFRFVPIERFRFHLVLDARLALVTFAETRKRRLDTLYLITLKPAVICGMTALLTRIATGHPRRVVVTLAGLGRLMGVQARRTLPRRLTEWAMRRMAKREAFLFTFETEHDRQLCLANGLVHPSRSITVNGAGVDAVSFHPRRGERRPGPLRVLFASRLLRSKGLDSFSLAARRWAGRSDAEFLVAGFADAGDPDALPAGMLATQPGIRFLGAAKSMPDLLRSVDIVCLPSRYGEGIPRILIEAAATGVAAIASDIEGCRAIVEHGRTGFLVPVADANATVAGIEHAMDRYLSEDGLLQRHSAAAYEKFLSGGYGEEAVIQQLLDFLTPEPVQPPSKK